MSGGEKHGQDALSIGSRNFFERTKFKLAGSFFVVMAGFMMLGYCAISGKFH